MKQRYHYNVANARVDQHVEKGNDDGLYISSVACCHELWALIMDAGTGFSAQVSTHLLSSILLVNLAFIVRFQQLLQESFHLLCMLRFWPSILDILSSPAASLSLRDLLAETCCLQALPGGQSFPDL